MRNILFFYVCLSIGFINAQNVLNDPSIVAQHKRMVFEKWGDFRPYPKYVLGVQTNFAYATIWGNWAPRINRDYKRGADIRPLRPTGEEMQRFTLVNVEEKEAEKIEVETDTLQKRSIQDFAHWTPLTVDADPLWLLYYKSMLTPLMKFPEEPQTYIDWQLKDEKTYQELLSTGGINKLKEELDLLKDKIYLARNAGMPRGKRFLLYHETLIGWRNFIKKINYYDDKISLYDDCKAKLKALKNTISYERGKTDKQIVENIMAKYKDKF